MKTSNQVITDVFRKILTVPQFTALNGGIYRKTRPTGSTLEDIVISHISGTVGKHMQDGAIQIKIFYNDIFQNNTYMEDTNRGQYLEGILFYLSGLLHDLEGYCFTLNDREIYTNAYTTTIGEAPLNMHYAILKMGYKLTLSTSIYTADSINIDASGLNYDASGLLI